IAIGARGLFALRRMAESSAGDFTVGKIQKNWGQRVAKMYVQQKRNIIHRSSTAYEQDHSAAAPPSSVMKSRRFMCGGTPPGKRKCSVRHRSRLQSCVRPVHAVRMDCWP